VMTKVAVITALSVLLFMPKLDLSAEENPADLSQRSNPIDVQIASIGTDQSASKYRTRP